MTSKMENQKTPYPTQEFDYQQWNRYNIPRSQWTEKDYQEEKHESRWQEMWRESDRGW